MNQKWNLQDIKPSKPSESRPHHPESESTVSMRRQPTKRAPEKSGTSVAIKDKTGGKRHGWLIALAVFILVVAGGLIIGMATGGAEVIVHPKHREPNVNATFTAYQQAQPDQLAYTIMTLDAEGERQVKANGTEDAKVKASGTLFIYNKYQSKSIRLVANTRFASPDGLIYRIQDPVVVPGYKKASDGTITPGVTTAKVYADQVGDTYNIAPARFTIPGFKGDPEYDAVYAESKEAFTGGFDGKRFIIADADLKSTQEALRTELRNSLLGRIDAEKPAGFTVFKDAVSFTYQTLPSTAAGSDQATIKEKATMRIPIFKNDDFASFIAAATVPGYEGKSVHIADPSTLTFSYTSATTTVSDISAVPSIDFKLTGRPQLIWSYDADKLKADLVGKHKTALNAVLGAYPAIEKAEAVIKPFWQSKFPKKAKDITVTEVLE